jgi:hypothetical protein
MNQKAQIRLLAVLLGAALVLATGAWQKKKAPEEEEKLPAMDRVARLAVDTSQQILHKTFTVRAR